MVVSGNIVERHDTAEVLSIIASRLDSEMPAGLAVGSVNLDHLHHFRKIASVSNGHLEWLLLADGMPIALRGRLLTSRPWPRVTGADLLPAVLRLAAASGQRVGFFGGSSETHRILAERLAVEFPALSISGMWSPLACEIDSGSTKLAAEIAAAATDVLVVSLGKPLQERWIDRYGYTTGARIFLPCGGAIDFMAGATLRAPHWMQRIGLEWFHRLTHEPRRLARRYLLQGPVALLLATRAQLICYPGVAYAGNQIRDGDSTESATA
ncbi:WecB/TagA/CpsF family glycosyltransferase [Mycobacterium sp. M1]|uniref:WecB/TagA/CpsF family glycosyltransferase n=2 Tax=Mycolicibacter acidiphilus TaxID=2835306 RepID=A0ABS5RGU1_9MYCO|nr:WecB/TagA/CpsF family glycosyltransferase [Mycolicibacter acidiphilus]